MDTEIEIVLRRISDFKIAAPWRFMPFFGSLCSLRGSVSLRTTCCLVRVCGWLAKKLSFCCAVGPTGRFDTPGAGSCTDGDWQDLKRTLSHSFHLHVGPWPKQQGQTEVMRSTSANKICVCTRHPVPGTVARRKPGFSHSAAADRSKSGALRSLMIRNASRQGIVDSPAVGGGRQGQSSSSVAVVPVRSAAGRASSRSVAPCTAPAYISCSFEPHELWVVETADLRAASMLMPVASVKVMLESGAGRG